MTTRIHTKEPLQQLLTDYQPHDDLEALYVKQLRQFLAETTNAYDRSNLIAHVVADAWIVNPDRTEVVLVEHALNKNWMAPGGHCDGNPDVFAAAQREAHEETGLTDLTPLLNGHIFDINVGPIPTRRSTSGRHEPAHIHFDLCFAFEAPHDTPLTISDESHNLAWVNLEDIPNLNYHQSHYRRPLKTLKL